jgi:hypothetical protein
VEGGFNTMPEEPKKIFCPQCKEWHPSTSFECLPLDLRCNKCVPTDVAMVLYDKRVQQAGQKISQIVDASEGRGLRPLERLVDGIYDAWGGPQAFCDDAVAWAKDLAASGRGKGAALSFMAKLLAIHAKVEKTRVEDDWNKLTKAEIKARLTLKLTAILADEESGPAKKNAIKKILGGDNLD